MEAIHQIESNLDKAVSDYEDEIKQIELKYGKIFSNILLERKEEVNKNKDALPNFWFNALSNHKLFKDFIASNDEKVLKALIDIRYEKLEDGKSFKLIFDFDTNPYFSNKLIEKSYLINDEHLIQEISSTKIEWTDKSLFVIKKEKKIKNKSK